MLSITKFNIRNFKGIKESDIKDAGRVNLFIGKNNCGKSTILEATYLACKEPVHVYNRENALRFLMSGRTPPRLGNGLELFHGYNTALNPEIQVRFNNGVKLGVSMEYTHPEQIVTRFKSFEPQADSQRIGTYNSANLSEVASLQYRFRIAHADEGEFNEFFHATTFLDPSILNDPEGISYFRELKHKNRDEKLAEEIRETYAINGNWEFVPHPIVGDFRVAFEENGEKIFYDNFGDGLRYGAAICSLAEARNDTALFIEEIESHQHPGALRKLIKQLLQISKQNNLQLFITTHSDHVWRYFDYSYPSSEEKNEEFTTFYVERDNSGKVTATPTEDEAKIADIFETSS